MEQQTEQNIVPKSKGKRWTNDEEHILLQNVGKLTIAEIAKKLDRTECGVYNRLEKLATTMHEQGLNKQEILSMTNITEDRFNAVTSNIKINKLLIEMKKKGMSAIDIAYVNELYKKSKT